HSKTRPTPGKSWASTLATRWSGTGRSRRAPSSRASRPPLGRSRPRYARADREVPAPRSHTRRRKPMRPPRYRFPDQVRSTTRAIASRMVDGGAIPRHADDLDRWLAENPAPRASLEEGGYG